jgi:anti-sigma B factor antagonist
VGRQTDPSTPSGELRCEIARNGQTAWVQPHGELDLHSVHRVETVLDDLRAEGCRDIVLDLRGLTFMDSTGLRLITSADSRAREQGRRVTIVQGPDAVKRVFTITRLDERLDIVEGDPPAASEAG